MLKKKTFSILLSAAIMIAITVSLSGAVAIPQEPVLAKAFGSLPDLLAQAPEANIEIKDPVFNDNSTPLYAVISLLISSIAAPLTLGVFKNRADRYEKTLSHAWDRADQNQRLLIEAKDSLIAAKQGEIEALKRELETARLETDNLQVRVVACETELSHARKSRS